MKLRFGRRYTMSRYPHIKYVEITDYIPGERLFAGLVVGDDGSASKSGPSWREDGTSPWFSDARLDGEYEPETPKHDCYLQGHELLDSGGFAFTYCKHCDTKMIWNRTWHFWQESPKQPRAS